MRPRECKQTKEKNKRAQRGKNTKVKREESKQVNKY